MSGKVSGLSKVGDASIINVISSYGRTGGPGTMSLVLNIMGSPIAQPAPQYHMLSRGGFVYNPVQKQQTEMRDQLCTNLGLEGGSTLFKNTESGWVHIEVLHFFFRRPEYHFLSHRSRCFENLKVKYKKENIPYIHKPDIDNLEKYLFDLLQGVIYHDDKMVCKVSDAAKYYDSEGSCNGRTYMKISLVDG